MFHSGAGRKVLIGLGIALALLSLVLLVYAFLPGGEPLHFQATLAPTLFAPPLGVAP